MRLKIFNIIMIFKIGKKFGYRENFYIINNMKRLFIIALITINTCICSPVFSQALDDFKDGVEQEEEENRQNDQKNDSQETTEESDEDSEDNPFMEFLWEITFLLWFIHNETVYYSPYPYELEGIREGNNFIGHDLGRKEDLYSKKAYTKNYNFAFYGGGSINETFNTYGGLLRFTGKFINHFGPEIDYRLLWDGKNLFHNLSGGLNLSFFQFDYLSLDFYLKAAFFMGLLERQGVSLGGKLTTYPFKPLSLEVRSGGMFFEDITFAEVDVKLGIHTGPIEIFGNFYTLQASNTQIYSFGLGAGVHF